MAVATPSPLTTPNPLKKPFKVAALGADLTSQTSKASLCDKSLALSQKPPLWGRIRWFWKRTEAPLREVPQFIRSKSFLIKF